MKLAAPVFLSVWVLSAVTSGIPSQSMPCEHGSLGKHLGANLQKRVDDSYMNLDLPATTTPQKIIGENTTTTTAAKQTTSTAPALHEQDNQQSTTPAHGLAETTKAPSKTATTTSSRTTISTTTTNANALNHTPITTPATMTTTTTTPKAVPRTTTTLMTTGVPTTTPVAGTTTTTMPATQNPLLSTDNSTATAANATQPAPRPESELTVKIKNVDGFCFFLPPKPQLLIAPYEDDGVAYCTTKSVLKGSKVFPPGFITVAHYLKGNNFTQVTGYLDPKKVGLLPKDEGGQYDTHGKGKPPGAHCAGYNFFVNLVEPAENRFCIRCCQYKADCPTGRSEYGCGRVVPGNYDKGYNSSETEPPPPKEPDTSDDFDNVDWGRIMDGYF